MSLKNSKICDSASTALDYCPWLLGCSLYKLNSGIYWPCQPSAPYYRSRLLQFNCSGRGGLARKVVHCSVIFCFPDA